MRAVDRLGVVTVDHKVMQNDLREATEKIMEHTKILLAETFRHACIEAVAVLEDDLLVRDCSIMHVVSHAISCFFVHSQQLESTPDQLDRFAMFVENLNSIRARYQDRIHMVEEVTAMSVLIDQHKVEIVMEDHVRFQNLTELGERFQKMFSQAEDYADGLRQSMSEKLELAIRDLEASILKLMLSLRSGMFKDPESDPESVLEVLVNVKENLNAYREKTVTYSHYLQLFGVRGLGSSASVG